MEMKGQVTILAARPIVWRALNDPALLALCIPGCEEVKAVSEREMLTRVAVRLGPVRARFVGKILISHAQENEGYRLEFEGTGGAAGFAKGVSEVTLADVGEATSLAYTTEATLGGKLGQLGGRLVDASAREMAERFFKTFGQKVSSLDPVQGEESIRAYELEAPNRAAPLSAPPAVAAELAERGRILWFGLGVASTALGVLIGSFIKH
jgi:carbon monoxide dehydrogenase subunit G